MEFEFLTEREVAARLKLSVAVLRKWRVRGLGPRFTKFSRAVRYSKRDLESWLSQCATGGGKKPELAEREARNAGD